MMKIKAIALILCIILCFSMLTVGCTKKECVEHVDENKDAKCDVCEAEVACEKHVDEDKNWVCDVCESAIKVPECDIHTDADNNLICDVCAAAIKAPCNPHTDTNADGTCDACGGAVVVIYQPADPADKTRVDMVVATIPTGVELGNYIDTVVAKDPAIKGLSKSDITYLVPGSSEWGIIYEEQVKKNIVTEPTAWSDPYVDDEGILNPSLYVEYFDRYTVKNIYSGQLLFPSFDIESKKPLYISENNGLIVVDKYEAVNADAMLGEEFIYTEYVRTYYAYDGSIIDKIALVSRDEVTDEVVADVNGWRYVNINGKVVVIENETKRIVAKGLDIKTLVVAPEYQIIKGTYGYIWEEDTIYIYNSSKLLECVYSYHIPSFHSDIGIYILDNGNVLVQTQMELETDAISYDIIHEGAKYDVIYTLINPTTKTTTNVEFGYYIESIVAPEGEGVYNDKVLNLATVHPIVNDRVDYDTYKYFVVDGNMAILYDANAVFASKYENIELLANGYYLATTDLGNGTVVREVLNSAGAHVRYLNNGCEILLDGACIMYANELYNFDLAPIYENYEIVYADADADYMILSLSQENMEMTITRFFIYNGAEIKEINLNGGNFNMISDYGFVIRYINYVPSNEGGVETVTEEIIYELYNNTGAYVGTLDGAITGCVEVEDKGCMLAMTTEGSMYILK